MQPNPIGAAAAPKSTQSAVCASEQMAGLVAVKTMGRVSTHGLSQHLHTRSNTHTHTESHSFGAFHTYGKQEVQFTDGGAAVEGETQVTPSGRFIHHIADRCISDVAGKTHTRCRLLCRSTLDSKNAQHTKTCSATILNWKKWILWV